MSINSSEKVDKLEFSFDRWRDKFLRVVLYATTGIGLIALIPYVLTETTRSFILAAIGFYIVLLLFTFLRMPYWLRASFFTSLFYMISLATMFDTGIRGEADLFFLGFIAISTIILTPRAGWYATGISVFSYAITGFAVLTGRFSLQTSSIGTGVLADWILNGVYILILSVIVINAIRLTQNEFKSARDRADFTLTELRVEQENLEVRVAERTAELNQGKADLELANSINARRANQFEAIALVTRAIVSLQNMEEMLTRVTESISKHFNYYHVGIFLVDEASQYAFLAAANSPGGQKMLERRHRLEIGKTGLVGFAAGTKKPHFALDTGKDAVFFNNPDLPDTRSEMALPLQASSELLGVLDVQSKEPNAFTNEDLAIFSILADQIAIAIQNSRLYENVQRLLIETRRAVGGQLQDAWEDYRSATGQVGYRTSGRNLQPLKHPVSNAQIKKSMETGSIVITPAKKDQPAGLAIPIILRGKAIGVMNIQVPERAKWDQDNIDIAEAIAERLSLAIENATLIETSRRRAARERTIGDITAKIGSSINLKNILQTAVEELGRALPQSDVVIQFQNKGNS